MEIILIWILALLIPVFVWGGYFDLLVDGVSDIVEWYFKPWNEDAREQARRRRTTDDSDIKYPYLVPDHERNEGDASKRKVVPFAWLMRRVEDDPFMDDEEWRWHLWCEDRREILEEFTRAVANLGMTVDDAARAMSSMRGDDADSD